VIGTLRAKPRYTNHPVVKGATFSAGAAKSIASTCTALLDCGEILTTVFTGMLKFQSPEEESTSSVLFDGLVSRRVKGNFGYQPQQTNGGLVQDGPPQPKRTNCNPTALRGNGLTYFRPYAAVRGDARLTHNQIHQGVQQDQGFHR